MARGKKSNRCVFNPTPNIAQQLDEAVEQFGMSRSGVVNMSVSTFLNLSERISNGGTLFVKKGEAVTELVMPQFVLGGQKVRRS